jgi:hypothetical protein
MMTQILFEIPVAYEAAVRGGSLMQVGGLLKDAMSGQIVAHLQESGIAQQLISSAMLGASSPVGFATKVISDLGSTGSGIYTAIQVNQIKTMVAGLQALQIATLGVSLVGVGVSVAGFAYMHKRVNALDDKIEELIDEVNSGFENQHKVALRSHLSQVAGLMQQATQAPTLSNPSREYSRIAEHLAAEAAHFEGELEFVVKVSGKINPAIFWQLAQTLMTCNSARIDCRLRTNELRNALTVAEDVSVTYRKLFGTLTPISFTASVQENAATVSVLKDITDVASTKPYLIDYLYSRRIDGPSYLARLEGEEDQPLLMLKVV